MTVEVLGVDPRCLSTARLKPPAPLPHVSRRALKRVKHRVEAPAVCPHCAAAVRLVCNSEIYKGRKFGRWPYAYLCSGCGAYVGLHPDTDLPLGTMADSFVRDARKVAKMPFTTLVRARFKHDRNAAYKWLSEATGIEPKLCHFAFMDEETSRKVFDVCYNALFEGHLDTEEESRDVRP